MFCCWRYCVRSLGRRCMSPHPTHGSRPMRTVCLVRILQVRPSVIGFKAFRTTFQIIEMPEVLRWVLLIQSMMCIRAIYLAYVTLIQRLSADTNFQPSFAASANEKSSNFFRHQPPHFFGSFRAFHLTQANILPCLFPCQRNL